MHYMGVMAVALAATITGSALADQVTLRVAGNFSGNKKHVEDVEQPFFDRLNEQKDLGVSASYNTMDALGIKATDALRLLKSGTFDVMSVQIGMASRDDPFFEGLDLAGVSTDMKQLRRVVNAYREAFDQRLQEKFNAKVMTLWPFGPQMIHCKLNKEEFDGFQGLKVRVFTPSMSALVEHLGGSPVTLQFSEVYPALQRGVADCAVTAPTAANNANWPEVTTHLIPVAVSGSVQGHFMNLDTWKKLAPDQQKRLSTAFQDMEDKMWQLADSLTEDAIACSTGQASCREHNKFGMKLAKISPALEQEIRKATQQVVLPGWAETCTRIDPDCVTKWNQTAGKAADMNMQ